MNTEIRAKILGGEAVDIVSEEEGSDDKSMELAGCLRFLQCGIGSSSKWMSGGKSFELTIHVPSIASEEKRTNVVKFFEVSPLTFKILPSHEKQPA